MDNKTQIIVFNAVIAALYFVLTIMLGSFSFLGIQIRISELLLLLCFFNRKYTFGITIGCILANILSPLGAWDVLFGSLATLLSCLCISYSKNLFIATLFPVVINGFVVGAELYYLLDLPFWLNVGTVALGEFISVSLIGYTIFMIIGKKEYFQNLIKANRSKDFKW